MKFTDSLKIYSVLLAFVFINSAGLSAAEAASFQGLGELRSYASSVSDDGLVVVGNGGGGAWSWTMAGGMVNLGVAASAASDVSADGSVVVGTLWSEIEAFRWTSGGGMVGLGYLPGGELPHGPSSRAFGVSADGSVIVGYSTSASGMQAFRWTSGGGMVGLGDLPGGDFGSHAQAVSPDGSVVVGVGTSASGREAFRWTEADGMVNIGALPGGGTTVAINISADGSVIVGQGGTPAEAFCWTEADGMVGLGILSPDHYESWAMAVSADGSVVVGGSNDATYTEEAFIWDEVNGMRSLLQDVLINECGLDLTGWTLETAEGISDDGLTIVGWGINPDGNRVGWIAVLPPPDPIDMIVDLIGQVVGLNLQQGIENGLDAKLGAALGALDDVNNNNDGAAINTLEAFINAVEAQRGNKISEADADALIAAAQEAIAALSGS